MNLNGYRKKTIKVELSSDGIFIEAKITSKKTLFDENTTTINIRDNRKIIPYLLIDVVERETDYNLTGLRDPIFKQSVYMKTTKTVKLFWNKDKNSWIGLLNGS